MQKNIDDMIVPERKRSIRDIPIPEGRRRNGKYGYTNDLSSNPPPREDMVRVSEEVQSNDTPSSDMRMRIEQNFHNGNNVNYKRGSGKKIWLFAGLAILVLIFALVSFWGDSTLTYIPRSSAVTFDNDIYTIERVGEGLLLFSVVKLSAEKALEVPATGEEMVERKASGTIIVYNNASTEPQRLIENTRFETSDGLVYRIPSAIVIPGRRTVSGETVPGSIETVVYADEAGSKYNIGLVDFSVPGLAGTPRFSTIYARSKTEMTGGFAGMERSVSESDKTSAKSQIEATLRNELRAMVTSQVPADFFMPESLSFISFRELPQTPVSGKNSVMFNMSGELYGIMFKRTDLSGQLAKSKVSVAPSETVDIVSLDSLTFRLLDATPEDLPNLDTVKFSVSGQGSIVWRTDEVALKADLAGRSKREVPVVLDNYPTIVSASATIKPFWRRSFPEDGSKILLKKNSSN